MSKLQQLFQRKGNRILNVYVTAGYPQAESTVPVMQALQQSGADIIELGMPYSDPLADGPVIQASSAVALQNGMTIAKLLDQVAQFRAASTQTQAQHLPVVLMGYLNPLLQYGFETFCAKAADVGVDALIIPDIPIYAYENEYGPIVKKYGLDFIFLITPETPDERIQKLDELSSGFLYAVSSSSVTGSDKDFAPVTPYLKRLQQMHLKNPFLVGFGIKDKSTFDAACRYANGAIIGSAYIKTLGRAHSVEEQTRQFIASIIQ